MPEPPHSAVARPERRQSQRRSCDFEIDIEWGAASLKGRVRELSGEGMFIELANPLWIGASFAATLALKNPVKVDCVVRRVIPRQGHGRVLRGCRRPARRDRGDIDGT